MGQGLRTSRAGITHLSPLKVARVRKLTKMGGCPWFPHHDDRSEDSRDETKKTVPLIDEAFEQDFHGYTLLIEFEKTETMRILSPREEYARTSAVLYFDTQNAEG